VIKVPEVKEKEAVTTKPVTIEGEQGKGSEEPKLEPRELRETVLVEKDEINFEINDANIKKYLMNVDEKRGKSGYNPLLYIRNFSRLLPEVKAFETRIELLIALLKIRSEATQLVRENVMTLSYWNETYDNLNELFKILKENPSYSFAEPNLDDSAKEKESSDEDDDKPKVSHKFQTNLLAYLELLDNFLTLGIKGEEPKSSMYIRWLQNEVQLLLLAEDVMSYYKGLKNLQVQVRLALIFLDRLHYKHDSLLKVMREKSSSKTKKEYYFEEDMKGKIEELTQLVYENGNPTQKMRATLYQVFYYALHGHYYKAHGLFIRVSQQQVSNVKLQIYYNRALVQLGLAAFQCGYIDLVVECLSEIMATTRLKEILAQGVSGRKEKSAKQEQDEIKKLLPYHMHMNLDLIEASYLISTMLIEVPIVAKQRHALGENIAMKYFRKVMQDFERRNVLAIPHDTVKENIASAVHKLQEGNWQQCYELIKNMSIWKLYRDSKDKVLKMIEEKIKRAGLLAYVHMSLSCYNSYSIPTLAQIFGLDEESISKIVARVFFE
jgi:translation initiation factor 3 subunit C